MKESSPVYYHGRDAEAVTERWHSSDRSFALAGVPAEADLLAHLADGRGECVVLGDLDDPLALVDRIGAADPTLSVVVICEGVAPPAAIERGATHVLPGDTDRIAAIESLAGVLERNRRQRRERTMLDSLLENIPLSVYFKDGESRYVRVSDAMLTMTGTDYIENEEGKRFHAPEDVVGTSEFDIFPSGPSEEAVADDRSVVEEETSIDNKIEHVYGGVLDGTFVATSKAPWYDERGDVVGLVGVTRDVSERKHYEHRIERQNERLERFAGVISHDLRNPLEVARGRVGLAREEADSEHLKIADRSLARMGELIDDVLTLARQGETVTDPEPVSIADAALEAWSVVDSGGADLVVETDATVDAEPGRLRQIFENLFRNAVKHGSTSPASRAREGVDRHAPPDDGDARRDDEDGRASEVERAGEVELHWEAPDLTVTVDDIHEDQGFVVSDDGRGIPEEDREAVFEAGYTSAESGTGFGLNIVRTIADAHGWHVSVTESIDGGAAFRFEVGRHEE